MKNKFLGFIFVFVLVLGAFPVLSANSCPVWHSPEDHANLSFVEDIRYNITLNSTDSDTNVTFSLTSINKTSDAGCFGKTSSGEALGSDFEVITRNYVSGIGSLIFNLSRDFLGNYTIDLEVSDKDWGGDCDRHIDISLSFNCSYDPPLLNDIPNQTILFNSTFFYDVDAMADAENLTYKDNTTLFNINSSTGVINFTANEVRKTLVNISVNDYNDSYDKNNYSDYTIVEFVIAKRPVINWSSVRKIEGEFSLTENGQSVNVTNSSMLWNENMSIITKENSTLFFNHSSFDTNAILYANNTTGNLTYSWKLDGNTVSSSKEWIYGPDFTDSGEYVLTLSVTNDFGFADTKSINLTVQNSYRNPVFLPDMKPKFSISYSYLNESNQTVKDSLGSFINTDAFISNASNTTNYGTSEYLFVNNSLKTLLKFPVNLPENITIQNSFFSLFALRQGSIVESYIVNGTWDEGLVSWLDSSFNSSWDSHGGDYYSLMGTANVNKSYEYYQWNVTEFVFQVYNNSINNTGIILTANSLNKFISSDIKGIPDVTLGTNDIKYSSIDASEYSWNLNDYFVEVESKPLVFSSSPSSLVDINIQSDGSVEFSSGSEAGTDTVRFYATNPGGLFAESNEVTIKVEKEDIPDPPVRTRTIEKEEEVEKKASLDIILNNMITLEPKEKVTVPIELRNSGELGLSDIDLSFNTSIKPSDNITLKYSISHFDNLGVGHNTTTNLDIEAKDALEGGYNITVIAKVSDPSLTQTAMIQVNVKETEDKVMEGMSEKIQFVRDLFEENPECLELETVLEDVRSEVNKGNNQKARNILNSAVDECRSLISYKEKSEKENMPVVRNVILIMTMGFVFIFVIYKIVSFKINKG